MAGFEPTTSSSRTKRASQTALHPDESNGSLFSLISPEFLCICHPRLVSQLFLFQSGIHVRNRLLLAIALVLALSSCSTTETGTRPSAIDVTAQKIEPAAIPYILEYMGFTESSHLVEIRARVEGYLDQIAYTEGEPVNEGDLLFKIDPRPFIAAVNEAKGQLSQQKALLWNAKRSVDRLKPLYEQKAASRRDLDNAIASLLSYEATVQSTKANLEQAELNLSYTTIKSPISGLAGVSKYREGALITPGQQGLLTNIYAIDPIWISFSVSENELLKYRDLAIKKKLEFPKDMNFGVEVILADGSQYPYTGRVNFAAPSLSQETGTMLVRADIVNSKGVLKPGQFVRVRLTGACMPHAIAVPQRAVLTGRKGMFVYVVENGKAVQRNIDAGDWYKNDWIINGGLDAGEVLIVDGVNKVQVGTPVNITKYVMTDISAEACAEIK